VVGAGLGKTKTSLPQNQMLARVVEDKNEGNISRRPERKDVNSLLGIDSLPKHMLNRRKTQISPLKALNFGKLGQKRMSLGKINILPPEEKERA
jgi:hypothetical protein